MQRGVGKSRKNMVIRGRPIPMSDSDKTCINQGLARDNAVADIQQAQATARANKLVTDHDRGCGSESESGVIGG